MKKKIAAVLFFALILSQIFLLSSCYLYDDSVIGSLFNNKATVGDTIINVSGGDDYDITIEADASVNTVAANKGLLSSVSVYASFPRSQNASALTSVGSGVIYRLDKEKGDAYIITNHHVLYSSTSSTVNHISSDISVYLYGQEREDYAIPATYLGGSMYYDIAVLKVSASPVLMASNAVAADFADSDEVAVLDTAIAIGNPKLSGISATLGYVSVDSEYISRLGVDDKTEISLRVMRIDAAVNEGNSGGGVFNSKGEVVGIVTAKNTATLVDGIGYAIPSNVARNVAENIIYFCDGVDRTAVFRCIMGITVTSANLRTEYDKDTGIVEKCEDVTVNEIMSDSAVAGSFKVGDVLKSVEIDGVKKEITRRHHLIDFMLNARPGEDVIFTILRGTKTETVTVTVTNEMLQVYG